jgi:predicted ATPase/class 3 adenylate cyclase
MPDLPSGTVTFLFTDIEGSTRLWEYDPNAMRAAVARHDELLTEAVATHHGSLYKHVGDAVQAAFSVASDALTAAVAAQQALTAATWPETGPLRVRMALHAGEAAPDARGDYHQVACLNRLSRLLATGSGGQILLTEAVRHQIADGLPAGVSLRDLGKHRMRDLLEPERVSQVVIDGLPDHFPPLRSLERHPTNLPVQPNALIGRERELAELQYLLKDETVRLVTLTGPGGTGKTRLALQAAAELLDRFEDGVFVIDLAPLSDSGLVLSTIAAILGVREAAGLSLRDGLVAYLGTKQLLLVLDNYEHLLQAAPVAADFLATSPGLRILATSRAPLRLKAEHQYPVEPLQLPTPAQLRAAEGLPEIAAVTLFLQRAQAVKPDFTIDDENAPAVAEICLRLDGLPLAIELAAARVKLLPPQALLARLEKRLPVLTGGARDAPTRQRTLRETIAWSYDLLQSDAQTLFRRLAVFASGTTFDALETVANPERELDAFAVLAELIDQSLVRQEEGTDGEPRFRILETIREFALGRVQGSGEASDARQRHLAWYVMQAEQAEREMRGPGELLALVRLEAELDNVRAALTWALEQEPESALRLAAALFPFWVARLHLAELRSWLERALDQGATADTSVRAKALSALAGVVWGQGDTALAGELAEEALALARGAGKGIDHARVLFGALLKVANASGEQGDDARVIALLEEALDVARIHGLAAQAALALNQLGYVAYDHGDCARAVLLLKEAVALSREAGHLEGTAMFLHSLGEVVVAAGDVARAANYFQDSLALFQQLRHPMGIAWCLAGVARAAAAGGQAERAARLFGAVATLREVLDAPVVVGEAAEHERGMAMVQDVLGSEAITAALRAGRALTLDEAIAEALSLADELVGGVEDGASPRAAIPTGDS